MMFAAPHLLWNSLNHHRPPVLPIKSALVYVRAMCRNGGRVRAEALQKHTAGSDPAHFRFRFIDARAQLSLPLPLRTSSLLPMASTPNSSSNFQSILDAALSDYAKQTGIDLVTHPSAQILQNCNSADAILDLLGDKAKQFQGYRDGNRKLINCLKPVVQVLHTVSGILGEVGAMVCLWDQLVLSHPILTVPFPGAIPTHESDPCRC